LEEFIGLLDATCFIGWGASWWACPPSPSLLISKKRGKHVHMMSPECYFPKLLRMSGRDGVHHVALDSSS